MLRLLSFLFFWNVLHLCQGEVSLIERQILLDLYESTQGQFWANSENWGNGDPCLSEWFGVDCANDSEITSIELQGNNLQGILPSSLEDLSRLENIDLSKNTLLGDVPSFSQESLQTIALSSNQLDGTIPSLFFLLPQIEKLHLNDNSLTGEILALDTKNSSLKDLDLSFNYLSGSLPFNFQFYPELQSLLVANNSLTGSLPKTLALSTRLQELDASNNYFSGFVGDWVCAVPFFDLSHNGFYCPLPDCCLMEGEPDKKERIEEQHLCSTCVVHTSSSSDDTPVALIATLCVTGGVLLLLIAVGVMFYFWRSSQQPMFTELKITEFEMVEDLLRDSDDDSTHTVEDNSDFDLDFETDSDHSDGTEY